MRVLLGALVTAALGACLESGNDAGVTRAELSRAISDHAAQSSAHHTEPTPGPGIARIGYAAFTPELNAGDLRVSGMGVISAVAGASRGQASVSLSVGSHITRLICFGSAPAPTASISAQLLELGLASTTVMAEAALSDSGTSLATFEAPEIVVADVIDHRDFVLLLELDNTGTAIEETSLRSCRIDYTQP